MPDVKQRTHATTIVRRNQDGGIQGIKVRAEYYVENMELDEDDPDRYYDGVNARFHFDVVDGDLAALDGVKDIEDDAPSGWDTSLEFLRALPVAEHAAMNVPGIDDVQSTEENVLSDIDKGQNAIET